MVHESSAELARRLREGNLTYREPALYDFLAGPLRWPVPLLLERGPGTSVLDLGCGTGTHLAHLHREAGLECVGVDVQSELLDLARAAHPAVTFVTGDLRGLRLERRFDVVVCAGNTPAYLLTDADLDAALETAAEHLRPGGLVLLETVTGDGEDGRTVRRLGTPTGLATVRVTCRWDPRTRISTTGRTWLLPDGRREYDSLVRRHWPRPDLERRLSARGLALDPALTPDRFMATSRSLR